MLIRTKVSRLCIAFSKDSSANIKLSKTQLHKIEQSGRFLARLLGSLLKAGLSVRKNVLQLLNESVLKSLRLTAEASTTDAAIQKKLFWMRYDKINNFRQRNE